MTKQLNTELSKWLDRNYTDLSESEYEFGYSQESVESKLLELQTTIEQLQQENKKRGLLSANLHNFLFNHASSIPDSLFYELRGMLREFTPDVEDSNNE